MNCFAPLDALWRSLLVAPDFFWIADGVSPMSPNPEIRVMTINVSVSTDLDDDMILSAQLATEGHLVLT